MLKRRLFFVPQKCHQECLNNGDCRLYGVTGNECYINDFEGVLFGVNVITSTNCTMPCPGDSDATCGSVDVDEVALDVMSYRKSNDDAGTLCTASCMCNKH